jgi:hypothetical protein
MLASAGKSSAVIEIERLGFKWHEEAQYDLDQLDKTRRIQVRESEHYAPKAQVAQYAVQMGQTQFPPIVVSRNNWLVDGNTREEAKKVRKEKFGAAIVVDADYGNGGKTDANFKVLAATLNQAGGQRLTSAETREVAKVLVEQGFLPAHIERSLGVRGSTVSQIRNELAAMAKFAKVGFTDAGKLSPPVIRALGRAEVVGLNDIPFKKLAELAVEANLSAKEIGEMAKEMKATGSDTGMITYIDAQRAAMADRIREHGLYGNGKPAPSSALRRALGYVTKYEATPSALVERSPAAMKEHSDVVWKCIEILQTVYKLQGDLIDA